MHIARTRRFNIRMLQINYQLVLQQPTFSGCVPPISKVNLTRMCTVTRDLLSILWIPIYHKFTITSRAYYSYLRNRSRCRFLPALWTVKVPFSKPSEYFLSLFAILWLSRNQETLNVIENSSRAVQSSLTSSLTFSIVAFLMVTETNRREPISYNYIRAKVVR